MIVSHHCQNVALSDVSVPSMPTITFLTTGPLGNIVPCSAQSQPELFVIHSQRDLRLC